MKKISNILIIVIVSVFSLAIGASAATTIASSSVIYGNTTVKAALDELMGIANQCPSGALCSKVKIGDYVRMTPTQTKYIISSALTGYDNDQTINPSELNLWRVVDVKSDGTIEMVSEYVSSTAVYFQGQQGYLNFIGALNTIANQYGNSNYTINTRHIGYHGQTATITDTSKFTNPASLKSTTSDNSNEKTGGGDIMYEYDTNSSTGLVYNAIGTLVANQVGTATATNYWLGSRYYIYESTTRYIWSVRYVAAAGYITGDYIYDYYGGFYNNCISRAIRPIVTLRPDITSFTGSGTSTSPWILS